LCGSRLEETGGTGQRTLSQGHSPFFLKGVVMTHPDQNVTPVNSIPVGYTAKRVDNTGNILKDGYYYDSDLDQYFNYVTPYDEPEIDDTVHCCPDCERPNQFGEVCPDCELERQMAIEEDRHDEKRHGLDKFVRGE
jgi:hypothetical protein